MTRRKCRIVAQTTHEADWVSRFADEVIAEAERRAPGQADRLRVRAEPVRPDPPGQPARGDDPAPGRRRDPAPRARRASTSLLGRLRPVPQGAGAGSTPSWAEHIGKPLTSVPAPPGSRVRRTGPSTSRPPMVAALAELGVEYRGISQTEQYTSGAYREQILLAMRERAPHRRDPRPVPDQAKAGQAQQPQQKQTGRRRGRARGRRGLGRRRRGRRRRRPAGVLPVQAVLRRLRPRPDHGHRLRRRDHRAVLHLRRAGTPRRCCCREFNRGKLVWKVDWPMRWAYEGVVFEPSGVDHSSPGSSFVVGGQIVGEIFGGEQPIGPMYAFVGISGMAKMCSSKGGVPTPADALEIMEAPLLRWLYARRRPNQSFKIAFDQEIQRLYDEWDALGRKVADGTAAPGRRRRVQPGGRAPPPGELPRHPAAAAVPHARLRRRHHRRRTRSRPCGSCATWTRPDPVDVARRGPAAAGPGRSTGSPPRSRPTSAPGCATSPTPSCSPRSTSSSASRCGCCSTAWTSTGRWTG